MLALDQLRSLTPSVSVYLFKKARLEDHRDT